MKRSRDIMEKRNTVCLLCGKIWKTSGILGNFSFVFGNNQGILIGNFIGTQEFFYKILSLIIFLLLYYKQSVGRLIISCELHMCLEYIVNICFYIFVYIFFQYL